jgi:hypothetical protein
MVHGNHALFSLAQQVWAVLLRVCQLYLQLGISNSPVTFRVIHPSDHLNVGAETSQR